MNKQSFIADLEKGLEGIVQDNVIDENVGYYRAYIEEEVKKGFSEQQVLEELGDPRLIARTIIDASGIEYTGGFDESSGSLRNRSFQEEKKENNMKFKQYDLNKWYWKILIFIFFAFILIFTVSLISALFSGAFYILTFIIRYFGVILLIPCLYWLIKGRR